MGSHPRSGRVIGQSLHRPALEVLAKIRRGLLGLGKVMLQVIAALPPLGAGDLPLVGGDEGEGMAFSWLTLSRTRR